MTLDILAEKNPFLMTTIGDFNGKSKWYIQDKTSFENKILESITSKFGLYQLINEPTHLLENYSSFIDLIFTSQPNLVVESGVHPSLHPNCHHQIYFAKLNLMISYPPPCSREIWHYREVNNDLIRRAISNFNWEKAFYNTNVNKKVSIFNETILNVLSNYIPHEIVTCDDKDSPWFNFRIKSILLDKNKIYKDSRESNTNAQLLNKLNNLEKLLSFLINGSKQHYYARIRKTLTNVSKNCKAYWSLLRFLLNNKRIPSIPPLFHKNKFVMDFSSHFATQCSLISTSSKLSWHVKYFTDNHLSFVSFSHDKIRKLIQNLNPNKAHGHENISIRMVEVCGPWFYKSLEIIFNQCL